MYGIGRRESRLIEGRSSHEASCPGYEHVNDMTDIIGYTNAPPIHPGRIKNFGVYDSSGEQQKTAVLLVLRSCAQLQRRFLVLSNRKD